MLTKTDLKSIEKVIDNRLDAKLDEKFDIKLKPITKRLINLERITTETQKDVRRLRKDLKTTSDTLDKENIKKLIIMQRYIN